MSELNTTTEIVTLSEARRRLALVRPLVEHLGRVTRAANELHRERRSRSATSEVDEPSSAERSNSLREEFEGIVRELNGLGATVKDAGKGLIDFYAWHDDEMIQLCWLLGEETIEYWHGMKDGFAGRRPVSELED